MTSLAREGKTALITILRYSPTLVGYMNRLPHTAEKAVMSRVIIQLKRD